MSFFNLNPQALGLFAQLQRDKIARENARYLASLQPENLNINQLQAARQVGGVDSSLVESMMNQNLNAQKRKYFQSMGDQLPTAFSEALGKLQSNAFDPLAAASAATDLMFEKVSPFSAPAGGPGGAQNDGFIVRKDNVPQLDTTQMAKLANKYGASRVGGLATKTLGYLPLMQPGFDLEKAVQLLEKLAQKDKTRQKEDYSEEFNRYLSFLDDPELAETGLEGISTLLPFLSGREKRKYRVALTQKLIGMGLDPSFARGALDLLNLNMQNAAKIQKKLDEIARRKKGEDEKKNKKAKFPQYDPPGTSFDFFGKGLNSQYWPSPFLRR